MIQPKKINKKTTTEDEKLMEEDTKSKEALERARRIRRTESQEEKIQPLGGVLGGNEGWRTLWSTNNLQWTTIPLTNALLS